MCAPFKVCNKRIFIGRQKYVYIRSMLLIIEHIVLRVLLQGNCFSMMTVEFVATFELLPWGNFLPYLFVYSAPRLSRIFLLSTRCLRNYWQTRCLNQLYETFRIFFLFKDKEIIKAGFQLKSRQIDADKKEFCF